jgi:hypothetical protein
MKHEKNSDPFAGLQLVSFGAGTSRDEGNFLSLCV